jgi:hypothetical protein
MIALSRFMKNRIPFFSESGNSPLFFKGFCGSVRRFGIFRSEFFPKTID